jgi:sugar phosphate isomerase/epimerase
MKVSLVTDELSSDFETAVELGKSWGINNFEIRGVGSERIGNHSDYTEHHLKSVIKQYGIHISSVSPGIFKVNHHKEVFEGWTVLKWQDIFEFEQQEKLRRLIEHQVEVVLPRTIRFCKDVGCQKIIIFSFNRPDMVPSGTPLPESLMHYFQEASSIAHDNDIMLYIENEHICYGDTVDNVIDIIKTLDSPNVRANWDPGNAYFAHELPYPDAYSKILPYMGHVHMKDAITHPDGTMEYVVEGNIAWEDQLQALMDDCFDGFISIETHCRPKVASAKRTLDRILRVCGPSVL